MFKRSNRFLALTSFSTLSIGVLEVALVHDNMAPGILAIVAGLLGVIRLSSQAH
jgi:hypothetical protein